MGKGPPSVQELFGHLAISHLHQEADGRSEMKLKLALASLIALFALPAFAQISTGTWYVVQDTSTKKCEVTSIKAVPGGTTKAVGKDTYSVVREERDFMRPRMIDGWHVAA
jgi:hypothetical protein